jgi:hypothetical protein
MPSAVHSKMPLFLRRRVNPDFFLVFRQRPDAVAGIFV